MVGLPASLGSELTCWQLASSPCDAQFVICLLELELQHSRTVCVNSGNDALAVAAAAVAVASE